MTRDTGFRVRETECGTQDGDVLNPETGILNLASVRRLQWRCRRGLLELDIVLGRFVERHYHMLDATQRTAFDELLNMPDTQLWDIITGKETPAQLQREFDAVLEMLRSV